ncbi:hypothetical protein [Bacillus sp. J33]|uniref:hypothetical protein n=1 Tax=Bacillus sp. J33 TaxID=935836 RepID=UPI00047E3A57|nr:hypothetical protein [Bacillus sp. J33]
MSSIGLRVTTSEIYYSIYSGSIENCSFVSMGKINEPAAYSFPQTLSYYKKFIEGLFDEYKIISCGIKVAEPLSGRNGMNDGVKKRLYIEGMLIETANNHGLDLIYGPFASFSHQIGIKKNDDYVKVSDFFNTPNWPKVNKAHKEACLAGVGGLK